MNIDALLNPEQVELFFCPICGKAFRIMNSFRRHLKSAHQPPITCGACLKPIKCAGRMDLWRQHLRRCQK